MNRQMCIEAVKKLEYDSKVRLIANVVIEGVEKECWFDYPLQYSEYICDERIDAFAIALVPLAMRKGIDIISSLPISEKLSYQLHNYYIPILSKYQETFHEIKLVCPCSSVNYNTKGAVGTGISCGIDSFYSVLKHVDIDEKNYQLTHLVTMNVGSFGYQGGEFSYNWFQEEVQKAKRVSDELKLPLIEINSNLMEIYQENHAFSGTFRMAGAILGIQKLFSKYYISAGFDIKDFDITAEDNDDYDMFNLLVSSNESTTFYSTGLEATRFERTRFIVEYPITYENLTVCMDGNDNCGKCEKCLRTLGTLYVLNCLHDFEKSFDIQKFEKHRLINLTKIRYYGIGYMRPLYQEIYSIFKKEEPFIYRLCTLMAITIVYPIEKIKKILKVFLSEDAIEKMKKIGRKHD